MKLTYQSRDKLSEFYIDIRDFNVRFVQRLDFKTFISLRNRDTPNDANVTSKQSVMDKNIVRE